MATDPVTFDLEDWYFTFGTSHEHPYGYVHVVGTFGAARVEMDKRYGTRWAFQYDAAQFQGQPSRYGLHQVGETIHVTP